MILGKSYNLCIFSLGKLFPRMDIQLSSEIAIRLYYDITLSVLSYFNEQTNWQNRCRHRHHHQPEAFQRPRRREGQVVLRLRRHRSEEIHRRPIGHQIGEGRRHEIQVRLSRFICISSSKPLKRSYCRGWRIYAVTR